MPRFLGPKGAAGHGPLLPKRAQLDQGHLHTGEKPRGYPNQKDKC